MTSQNLRAAPVVSIVNNHATALSTDVARYFGKDHYHVLRDIENLIESIENLTQVIDYRHKPIFGETAIERPNPLTNGTIKSKAYRMDRDAFTLLVMGWTGEKALQFKLAWLAAFNEMEAQLYGVATTITPAEQAAIQQAVAKRAKSKSCHYQTIYKAIKARYQIPRYDALPRSQFEDCLSFIENLDLRVPDNPQTSAKEDDTLTSEDWEFLRSFDEFWLYNGRPAIAHFYSALCAVQSPLAPEIFNLLNNPTLFYLERLLKKHGYPVAKY